VGILVMEVSVAIRWRTVPSPIDPVLLLVKGACMNAPPAPTSKAMRLSTATASIANKMTSLGLRHYTALDHPPTSQGLTNTTITNFNTSN
jgi:hypothetical protein